MQALSAQLERNRADQQARKEQARQLRDQAHAVQQQGRIAESIGLYKQSLALWPDKELEAFVAQLERGLANQQARKEQARQLRDQAHAVQQQGRIAESIGLYKQSLALWPDKELEAFVAQLERGLADQQARKAQAKQLRDQAHAVQQQGRIAEAIGLYKQSLALWPDKELEAFVGQLERGLAQARAAAARPSAPAPAPSAGPAGQAASNMNVDVVHNGPTRPSTFTLQEPRVLVWLQTYHWNQGRGAPRALWACATPPDAVSARGQPAAHRGKGVVNAYWNVRPGVLLPAGEYTVVDSDPSTWAQNAASQGAGHFRVETAPAGPAATAAQPRSRRRHRPQPQVSICARDWSAVGEPNPSRTANGPRVEKPRSRPTAVM
ncbi:MAG: tetratricopeptide repeat protein [Burkholderiaceae bacterium]|nr:MAG: tetratricopeptide repeat protein [Burkholderiaceae bacterium]